MKWVREMIKKYDVEKYNKGCSGMVYNKIVVCIDSNRNIGIAKCHPDDDYDYNIGIAIAYARCKGIKVPKVTICKKLSEMKNGETFKDMFGCTCKYIGENKGTYVVYVLNYEDYYIIPYDAKCEMVD
jgi:hypothetical protein